MGRVAVGRRPARLWPGILVTLVVMLIVPLSAAAAPYAAYVIDARTGQELYARNANERLHPASLTKMMTLYIVFEAIENGEIGLDDKVTISRNAASEPPSKLGLRPGQKIRLRYLIRAAAVKSANDSATALAEAIEGSEARFARRMNRTAKALGMTRTTFRNAHGLTARGHLSTAHDMTILGRHLFYDYPQYYNLFSRIKADAGVRTVWHTNRRLLRNYPGADGIKTGYTSVSGFNLVASAQHHGVRIIATVFGGRSVAARNARVKKLLDLGFKKARRRVAVIRPERPPYMGKIDSTVRIASADRTDQGRAARTVRPTRAAAITRSLRPQSRPGTAGATAGAPVTAVAAADMRDGIKQALATITSEGDAHSDARTGTPDVAAASVAPERSLQPLARPEYLGTRRVASADETVVSRNDNGIGADAAQMTRIVSRVSTSGGRHWGINVGRYPTEYKARQVLLQTGLGEMATLEGSLRKVVRHPNGFDANFMGLNRITADRACRHLHARNIACFMIGPPGEGKGAGKVASAG